MFNIGWPELVLILLVCLLIFGAGKLPEVARQLSKAIQEFKKSLKGGDGNNPEGKA